MPEQSSEAGFFNPEPEASPQDVGEFKSLYSATRKHLDTQSVMSLYYFLQGRGPEMESLLVSYIASLPDAEKKKTSLPQMLESMGWLVAYVEKNIKRLGSDFSGKTAPGGARAERQKNSGKELAQKLTAIRERKNRDREELDLATDNPEKFWQMLEGIGKGKD